MTLTAQLPCTSALLSPTSTILQLCHIEMHHFPHSYFAQFHLTLALEMPEDVKVLNVPVLGTIVHVLGSFAGLVGRAKDAEMK